MLLRDSYVSSDTILTTSRHDIGMRSNLTRAAIAAMLVFPAALAAQVMPTGTSSADKLFASGDFSGAAAAYEGILRTRPSDLDANRGAATTALYRNDIAAASAYAQAALSM